jgi:hypothetical protein
MQRGHTRRTASAGVCRMSIQSTYGYRPQPKVLQSLPREITRAQRTIRVRISMLARIPIAVRFRRRGAKSDAG